MAGARTIRVRDGETISSVVRRIHNTVEQTVILESDGADDLFLSEINLRLILYYAQEEHKDILIQSDNPGVQRLCRQLGLDCRTTAGSGSNGSLFAGKRAPLVYQPDDHLDPVKTPGPVADDAAMVDDTAAVLAEDAPPFRVFGGTLPRLWWLIPLSFLAGAMFWVMLWANPSVTVVVHPSVRQMVTDMDVTVSVSQKKPDIQSRVLPAHIVDRQGDVEFTLPTTGRATVGFKPARGLVSFINDNANPVTVPKGSIVTTEDGIKFATLKDTVVPRRTVEYFAGVPAGLRAGQADVQVEAVEAGVSGNVGARRIRLFTANPADSLRVINPEPAFGGEDRQIRVLAPEDLARAEKEAKAQALAMAMKELERVSGSDKLLFDELTRVEVQSVQATHRVGDETAEIGLKASYRATSLAVEREPLAKLVAGSLAAALPASFSLAGDSVRLLDVTGTPQGIHGAVLHVSVESRVYGIINKNRIKKALAGKTDAEAREYLGGAGEIGQYNLKLPAGRRFPRWSMRVRVIVVEAS